MLPEIETLRITVWVLAAFGAGLIVYIAWCLDRLNVHLRAVEDELEAMRMERWAARPTIAIYRPDGTNGRPQAR